MKLSFLRMALPLFCAFNLYALPAMAQEHAIHKRPYNLPPAADLIYSIKARYSGIPMGGEAVLKWDNSRNTYSVVAETRAMFMGKILESKSEGSIDAFGLAPAHFIENRLRKSPTNTSFNRAANTISFSESAKTYPLMGGEQDRTSIIWQLISVARAAPDKFIAGSEWAFFVAGQRDAEPWTFKVTEKATIKTPMGELAALHVLKAPPPDSKEQRVELWLAPTLEWYPVRLRFTDEDGNVIEQFLEKITRKAN